MARIPRAAVGDTVYHVLNRANGRQQIFQKKITKLLRKYFEKVPDNLFFNGLT